MRTKSSAPPLELPRHRFTADEFQRMVQVGLLTEDDRLELVEGEIIEMSPIGGRHAGCVRALIQRFATLVVQELALLDVQNPLRLDPSTELYPDVMLLRPRADNYAGRHPRAADVLLLVEVSDTTLRYDREVKLPLYAGAGVAEVWIVDLSGEVVLVHRQPGADGYSSVRTLRGGERVAPTAFGDCELAVSEVLG